MEPLSPAVSLGKHHRTKSCSASSKTMSGNYMYTCPCKVYTIYGCNLRVTYILPRASDCAVTAKWHLMGKKKSRDFSNKGGITHAHTNKVSFKASCA